MQRDIGRAGFVEKGNQPWVVLARIPITLARTRIGAPHTFDFIADASTIFLSAYLASGQSAQKSTKVSMTVSSTRRPDRRMEVLFLKTTLSDRSSHRNANRNPALETDRDGRRQGKPFTPREGRHAIQKDKLSRKLHKNQLT